MVLRFQFFLAVSVCHEVAHFIEASGPIHAAVPGLQVREVYYKDHTFREAGAAFETQVFGGRVHPVADRVDCAYGMTVYDYDRYVAQTPLDLATYYSVSMDFIAMLQQKETWERDYSSTSCDVFHIPRNGAKAVFLPHMDMVVYDGEDGEEISDETDFVDTAFKRTIDGQINRNRTMKVGSRVFSGRRSRK